VRRLFTWAAGAAGGLAAYRAVSKRKPAAAPLPPAAVEAPDPAEELRAKLAEAKTVEDDPVPLEVDRRNAVHEQARAAIDEMKSD
jgi:hypothetical protein